MTTQSETEADGPAHETVLQGLDDFNEAALKDAARAPIRIFSRDDNGQVCGGAIGFSLEKWAFIDVIWVAPEKRGQGLGARILREVETLASSHGSDAIFLDTFDFQAPGFYLRHGYEILVELPNVGALTRYFLRKTLP